MASPKLSNDSKDDNIAQTIVQIVTERKPQTVEQLMLLAKEKLSIPEREILSAILDLQNQGTIKLEYSSSHPSATPASNIRYVTAVWYWLTIATASVTAIIVFVVPEDLYPLNLLRIAFGAVFVLWLPGYTLIKALFPTVVPTRTTKRNLDTIERTALSLGMSLALVPMVGLVLNFTPWGIRLTPIVLSLLALTVIFATVAIAREYGLQANKKNNVA